MPRRAITLFSLAITLSACRAASVAKPVVLPPSRSSPTPVTNVTPAMPSASPDGEQCYLAVSGVIGQPPAAATRQLARLGYNYLGEWLDVGGVTVVSGVVKETGDGHFQNIFFFRGDTLLASDRSPAKTGRTHFTANICSAQPGEVTTGYIVNETPVGGQAPGCPPAMLIRVRWQVAQSGVRRLDALPRNCG